MYIIKLKFCFIKIYTPLENSILFNNKIAQSQHFGIIESLQTTIKICLCYENYRIITQNYSNDKKTSSTIIILNF